PYHLLCVRSDRRGVEGAGNLARRGRIGEGHLEAEEHRACRRGACTVADEARRYARGRRRRAERLRQFRGRRRHAAAAQRRLMIESAMPEPSTSNRGKPRVVITYCTQCHWLLRAGWMAQELLSTFATDLGEVALVPGTGGIFTIACNDALIW